jgi:hypothetical protein
MLASRGVNRSRNERRKVFPALVPMHVLRRLSIGSVRGSRQIEPSEAGTAKASEAFPPRTGAEQQLALTAKA